MAPVAVRGGNALLTDNLGTRGNAAQGRGRLVIFCAVAAWLLATVPDAAEPPKAPVALTQAPTVRGQPAKLAQVAQQMPQPGGNQLQPQPQNQPGGELPQPRMLEGFRPGQDRLERMGNPRPFGSTPVPTAKDLALQRDLVEEFVDPHNVLDLVINRTRNPHQRTALPCAGRR